MKEMWHVVHKLILFVEQQDQFTQLLTALQREREAKSKELELDIFAKESGDEAPWTIKVITRGRKRKEGATDYSAPKQRSPEKSRGIPR